MTLTVPLAVRLSTAKGDVHVTRDLHDLTFRSTAPGGFASATFTLSRPLALQPDEIDQFGEVYVYDRRDGSTAWEGRLDDAGRTAGDAGEIWQLTATGPAAHALDRNMAIVYVDTGLDGWSTGGPPGSTTSVNVSSNDNQAIQMSLTNGTTFQAGLAGLSVYHQVEYTGQQLARVTIGWVAGMASSNFEFRLGTSLGVGATVAVDTDAASLTPGALTGARGGTNAITAGHDTVRLRFARNVSDFTATNDTIWVQFTPVVRGLLKDAGGTDITSGYTTDTILGSDVVKDVLGRLLPLFDGPNASVETTLAAIDQLSYPDGTTASAIFADLMTLEPAYTWAAWERNSNGLHRFEWTSWPSEVRYEASAADGFSSPSSASELYNRVSVRWRNSVGVGHTTYLTQAVPALDDIGLIREAYIDLSDEVGSAANATQAGTQFLAEHQTPVNQGTLTIARPILDLDRGRYVMPWEVRPGHLIRVRSVMPRIDALNATARDGITVFKIAAAEYNAGSGVVSLELDSYPLTVSRAIADLSKRRITRKR